MINPRKLALNASLSVLYGNIKPKDALNALPQTSAQERSFIMEVVYGIVRYKETLDWALKKFLKNPTGLGPYTMSNLRCGAYQLLFMRVPEWAAVDETVGLEKHRRALTNAVLRNLARSKKDILTELREMETLSLLPSVPQIKRAKFISITTSHPEWLIKRWIKRFGTDEALELARANNQIPPLTLRINTLRTTRDSVINLLKDHGIEADPTLHSPDGIVLRQVRNYKELLSIEPRLKDKILAQDEAAQLISYMLEPRPGQRVLDACAAPGGKTTHIAQIMSDKGEVLAVDINEQRLQTLKENVKALGLQSIKILLGDSTRLKIEDIGLFDRVLLDAPCTAIGTIRRNPDVKYRYSKADLAEFNKKQTALLQALTHLLKPDGILLYCTCSIEPEEGEMVINKFLKERREFYIIKDLFPPAEGFLTDGIMRTYPHRHGMDGFFAVRLGKK